MRGWFFVPSKYIDNVANKCYTYTYDEVSNVTEEYIDGVLFKDYEYDNDNRLTRTTVSVGGATQAYLPIYDKTSDGKIYCDNAVVGVELEGVFTHKAEHDEYGRTTEKNLTLANGATPILSDEYTYLGSATRLTHMVSSVTQKLNGVTQGTFGYTYDNNGNITEIRKNNSLIAKYTYDEMNQLVREDNYLLNKTYIFTYDTAGNILSKKTYNTVLTTGSGTPDATIAYTYATSGWKDRLISVGGEAIVYDVLGNPTTYRGHNLTWGKLRQLNSFDNNTFTYNAKGIRTSKNNISYTLDGTKILSETRPTGTIKYLYGASGVIGFTYNGNTYYYEKNIQGDVTAIVNASGAIKAKYTYDAWGNHTITLDTDGIGTLNAIRYRSYYYDVETGLYYLQSRYYDPAVGRFINADKYISTGTGILGSNMYAYCNNNPIIFCDKSGAMRIRHVLMSDQRAFSKPQTTSPSYDVPEPRPSILPRDTINQGREVIKQIANDAREFGNDIREFLEPITDSVEFELGLGVGFGGTVEAGEVGITAVARYDYISASKKAGEDIVYGTVDEATFNVSAGITEWPIGYKDYYDFDGNIINQEIATPSFSSPLSKKIQLYVGYLGCTIEIGFDMEHFINSLGGIT